MTWDDPVYLLCVQSVSHSTKKLQKWFSLLGSCDMWGSTRKEGGHAEAHFITMVIDQCYPYSFTEADVNLHYFLIQNNIDNIQVLLLLTLSLCLLFHTHTYNLFFLKTKSNIHICIKEKHQLISRSIFLHIVLRYELSTTFTGWTQKIWIKAQNLE